MKIYMEKKESLSKAKINKIKKQVVDIVKKNATFNIETLNNDIIKVMNIDETFKDKLIKHKFG